MAGGPRKFSEKIALLNQKEAEANAAFNSILSEIAQVHTNSGSQLDMNQPNETNAQKMKGTEDSMKLNESVIVTYDNQQNNNFVNQYQEPKVKKHGENIKDNLQPMQNSFLQLPNQTDSFRRALSDSSINHKVTNAPNSNSFHSNNFQPNYVQSYQQQNQSNTYQNYQSANFQLSFSDYDTQQSASNMAHMSTSNVSYQKFFKNDASSVQSGARTLSPAYQPPSSSNYNQEEFNFHSPYLQANTNLKPDSFLSPNSNLSNPQNSNGGSLPDLTAFQFQNNQFHQNLQLHDYSQRQKNNYENQLLQPNIQQHNHIGPVKPTHLGSVSPTRNSVRYSPTNVNRRPSPQRSLPPGINTQSKSSLSAHSTPTSPLHSNQTMPILEFTINSSQANNYVKNMMNNGVYRNTPGNVCQNGGESLPPSPQSQQSCFNSPQGSPDPLSISPQDMNPFTSSNNYEIIQKKFDCINLDSTNNQFNFGQFLMNNSNQMVKKNRSENIGDTMDSDVGAKNQSLINSRNESLSSIGSSSNQANNLNLFNDIENYQQNTSFKNNVLNKNHKNSIPNIILTYPAEEKGDMVISQELSSDLNFDVANLLDFSNFTGPVSIDDVNSINFNESI